MLGLLCKIVVRDTLEDHKAKSLGTVQLPIGSRRVIDPELINGAQLKVHERQNRYSNGTEKIQYSIRHEGLIDTKDAYEDVEELAPSH